MPVETTYIKSLSVDFPNGKINSSKLTNEIRTSVISVALERIDREDDTVKIVFKDVLTSGDQAVLDSLVSQHDGQVDQEPTIVKISEEDIPTGGHWSTYSDKLTAASGQSATLELSFPFPVSCLTMEFETINKQEEDTLDLVVAPDTVIAITSEDIGTVSAWTAQNYVVGNKVSYTHPTLGSRVYTCVQSTVSNEPPTNKAYWSHGYKIALSSTQYTEIGYYLSVGSDDLGRVISKTSSVVYVEKAPTGSHSSGTQVKQNIYMMKGFYLGVPTKNIIGEGKIGGTYIPADTVCRLTYHNNGGGTDTIYGILEYLY